MIFFRTEMASFGTVRFADHLSCSMTIVLSGKLEISLSCFHSDAYSALARCPSWVRNLFFRTDNTKSFCYHILDHASSYRRIGQAGGIGLSPRSDELNCVG